MIRPLGARALVKRLDEPRPQSTIIIPETIDDKPSKFALVIALGTLKQGGFDVGDTVVLTDYAGAPCTVDLDGDLIDAVIVSESDVLMVVDL